MQFGLCTTIDRLDWIRPCGFDYIEIPLNSYSELSEQKFGRMKSTLEESGIPSPTANFFFPVRFRLTGPEVDYPAIREYSRRALDRAARMGTKLVVVGSGKPRSAPEGFDKAEAVKQFGEHCAFAGEEGAQYGIVTAMEAIRPASTNILNTIDSIFELMQQINHPNVKIMADFSQMKGADDHMDSLLQTKGHLVHAHICSSKTTDCPLQRGEDDYESYFEMLKSIGYPGNMTVEVGEFRCEKTSAALLRELATEYGL